MRKYCVYVCECEYVRVSQEEFGLADRSPEPLILSAGLWVTRASSPDLLTPWPKSNQNTTLSPSPEPPRPSGFKPHSAEMGLTANLHHWHTTYTHVVSYSVIRNNHCNMPQQDTVCVTPQWFLSPPMFVCHQLTVMRTVGLDRKPSILCYYGSAIITQEVCLSWPQPPSGAAERRQNHL